MLDGGKLTFPDVLAVKSLNTRLPLKIVPP
jgi:hypothetical protein